MTQLARPETGSAARASSAAVLPGSRVRRSFRVSGVVQGVGFRPFVYVTATALALSGEVSNDASGVLIEVEGEPEAVDRFAVRLRRDAPSLARVERVQTSELPPRGGTGFTITASRTDGPGTRTLAGPDTASCPDCRRELTDRRDRRYRHPFISCTSCGPRFTIITDLPYDRPATTMAGFPLCPECAAEYADPADRRFHAQPVACHRCGPVLELVVPPGRCVGTRERALAGARSMLARGRILAVKGLGGYHLVCDAGNDAAVAELRVRKRRGDKPFAVMVRDLDAARHLVHLDPVEAALLSGSRRPVLLARRRDRPGLPVATLVAPGTPDLGVLLPYTPVHELLLGLPGEPDGPPVLVMTSANLGGEPIAYDDADAEHRLAPLVDGWLRHDRRIQVPCDDSVSRVVDGREVPLRRSRGHAPLPVALPFEVPATLAVGADLKNTCCLAEGRYAWLSQHIGDMDDLATLTAFERTEQHLERLTGVTPGALVADAHPAYRSADWARRNAGDRPVRTVQHHHAHVAAVMGEHGVARADSVIGVAFDGTGYGTDGAVWGGEVLLAGYGGFERFAHLSYVPLPGGDAAVERPCRMALAHLYAAGVPWRAGQPAVDACSRNERAVLEHQLSTGLGCVPTSSMGRLFDAVAALVGVREAVDFEAQAAIELEGLARSVDADAAGDDRYRFALTTTGTAGPPPGSVPEPLTADAAPVVRAVVDDVSASVPAALVAARFHAAAADLVRRLAIRARDRTGLRTVALSGGVFANAVLLSGARRALVAEGFTVLVPQQVPPNDGGLALGQVLVAATRQS